MDFFKSILSEDPEPIDHHHQQQSDPDDSDSNVTSSEDGYSGTGGSSGAGIWTFGDIVKTLTTKSESVFETYRKDLKEFGTGLKKESHLFRDVAIRAVNELPEVGSSVIKSTADNIIKTLNDVTDTNNDSNKDSESESVGLSARNVSRFDAKLSALRGDVRTYVDDVEDVEDFEKWKLTFVIGDKKDEIEKLVGEGGEMCEVYEKCVPSEVDDGMFWFRYFYKVCRLEVQEEMRAKLVKRSLSVDDDEELSWDVDDDEEEDEGEVKRKSNEIVDEKKDKEVSEVAKTENVVSGDKDDVVPVEKSEAVLKSDEKVDVEAETSEVKESDVVVESEKGVVQEEEDLEWDEIEDLGDHDDKKVSHGDSPNKDELRKRLSAPVADDDEDLSWDIEDDDDEPAKEGNK